MIQLISSQDLKLLQSHIDDLMRNSEFASGTVKCAIQLVRYSIIEADNQYSYIQRMLFSDKLEYRKSYYYLSERMQTNRYLDDTIDFEIREPSLAELVRFSNSTAVNFDPQFKVNYQYYKTSYYK